MKYIRPLFYVAVLIILGVSIELKKEDIRTKRAAPVESVLSLMGENGLPIKIYQVQRKDFAKQSLYHVDACSRKTYCFGASAAEARAIEVGNLVRIPGDEDKVIGKVVSVSRVPLLETGLYQVKLRLDESLDQKLVRVDTFVKKNGLVLPMEAVTQLKGEAFVYVYKDGQPEKRNVVVEKIANNEALVSNGVNDSEVVIVEGLSLLELFDEYQVVGEFEKINNRER